jgi:hypothetical protein
MHFRLGPIRMHLTIVLLTDHIVVGFYHVTAIFVMIHTFLAIAMNDLHTIVIQQASQRLMRKMKQWSSGDVTLSTYSLTQ